MEEAREVSLHDRQMSMDLFELHSYLQFTYEYVEESLMLKNQEWYIGKDFLQAMQNWQL